VIEMSFRLNLNFLKDITLCLLLCRYIGHLDMSLWLILLPLAVDQAWEIWLAVKIIKQFKGINKVSSSTPDQNPMEQMAKVGVEFMEAQLKELKEKNKWKGEGDK